MRFRPMTSAIALLMLLSLSSGVFLYATESTSTPATDQASVLAPTPPSAPTPAAPTNPTAATTPAPTPPLTIERTLEHGDGISEVRFTNGLRMLHRENRTADVVATSVFVKVGSIYEGDMIGSGISHYFEHIIHGGATSHHSEAEAREILKNLGNNSNAYTTTDATVYFVITDAEHFSQAAGFLGDCMANCQIAPAEFERERGVIIQEIRKNRDNPQRMLMQLLSETMFPNHPVGQPVIGYEELFRAVTRDQLVDFYHRFYVANNMTVVVTGNISQKDAATIVSTAFADTRRGILPPVTLPTLPRQLETRWAEQRSPVFKQTLLAMGHRSVTIDSPDLPALDILATIMGDGESSRLSTALRATGLVRGVNASSHTPAYPGGMFTIHATLEEKNLADVLEKIIGIIAELKETPVTEAEIQTAIRQREASYAFYNESVESQAQSIGWDDLTTQCPNFSVTYLKALQKVRPADICRVAKKYLTDANRTVAIVRPETKPAESENHADNANTSAENNASSAKDSTTEAKATTSALPEKFTLKNGLRVLCQQDPSVRTCFIMATFPGGVLAEEEGKNGVSQLMTTMLMQGTKKRDRATFHADLDTLGAEINAISGNNSWYATIRALADDAEAANAALAEALQTPRMAQEDFDREKNLLLQGIRMRDDSWSAEADTFFRKQFFAGTPYANPTSGTLATVENITLQQIKDFHAATLGASGGVLAFFGNITPEKARAMAEKHWAALPQGTITTRTIATHIPESGFFGKPNNKGQVVLSYGYPCAGIGEADQAPLTVLDTIISGYGYPSGALHETLRGDADLVYLVHAYVWPAMGTGAFRILTQTSTDNVNDVMRRIGAVMRTASEKPFSDDVVAQAKNAIQIARKIDMADISSRATTMATNELLGLGYDYHLKEDAALRHVTAADVLRVAAALFPHEIICATGPTEAVDAANKAFMSAHHAQTISKEDATTPPQPKTDDAE